MSKENETQEMSEKDMVHFINDLFTSCYKNELSEGKDMTEEYNNVIESLFESECTFIIFEEGQTFKDLKGNKFKVLDIYRDFNGNKKAMGLLNGEYKVFSVGVTRGIFSTFVENFSEMPEMTAEF